VPLDERHTVLDWMSVLRIPIVLVAGSYVGTVSHSLTALEVLARRNLDVAAVVVSESGGSAASLADTVATVQHFVGAIDVVALPRLAPGAIDVVALPRLAPGASDHPAFAQLAALI
jgi:dethiobiotin synthetase